MMLLLGTGLADPGVVARRARAVGRRAVRGPAARRGRRRHGLSDDARAHHRAVVGPGAHAVDRAVVGARRRDLRARAAGLGRVARAASTGARCSSSRCRSPSWRSTWRGATCPRTSTRRRTPSTTSAASCRCSCVAALVLAINFAPVPNKGTLVIGLDGDRRRSDRRFLPAPAPCGQPALRPRHRRRGGSSGSPRCAGIIVFGSLMGAMFIGQQFLQNVLGYSTLRRAWRSSRPRCAW